MAEFSLLHIVSLTGSSKGMHQTKKAIPPFHHCTGSDVAGANLTPWKHLKLWPLSNVTDHYTGRLHLPCKSLLLFLQADGDEERSQR